MGNVVAASSGIEPTAARSNSVAASLGLPEPAQLSSRSGTDGAAATLIAADVGDASKEHTLENPGTVEELHKKCKDVQAITFEGAKIMLNKGLSNHFQVSHTINLSTTVPSGYRFGATYVGTKQYSPTEAFPVLLGDIDPSGNLNANVIHQFSSRLRCKFASQIQESKVMATQLSTDYRGNDFTASITLGNPSIFTNSGVIVGQYLQSVTQRTALGAEVAYQYGPNVPGRQIAIVSALGRYTNGDSIWSGTLGPSGLHLCYYQKASEQLQIGVEVETSLRMQESVATIAYQIDLPKADLVFKGSIDSNWHISGVLEKRLQPLPFSFTLSGRMNHVKNNFKLGCGLMIG
ncbi:LOW QUALITY PROTEIN: mitochondrial import receptor subunit TOM40 homolog 1 [Drosophila nasuta]|uniref:LOW QUALITY PROTEIN: mitochondrial import receptor subunit TOM40 homolog 1 n=1 Tax=Drosophila nasuta TaxID=42062 RepID=UPI00295F2CA8|nr:LOW QUALITY PROTEIN: mitochondrial import receptor subunit TOM40 homolog 1 [Drosophila nasuta]